MKSQGMRVSKQNLFVCITAKLVGFITCVEHYIDMLFVDPEYTRRGVASALLKPLIKSESELTVDASITAKPFFERYGFQTVKQQRVECRWESGLLSKFL